MRKKLLILIGSVILIKLLFVWAHWMNDPSRVYATNYRRGGEFFKEGNYTRAIYFWETAWEQIQESAPESPDETEVLAALCVAYTQTQEYDKAKKSCTKALTVSESLFGTQSLECVELRWMLGRISSLQNKNH